MDYLRPYIDFLMSKLKLPTATSVVFDCSNGTTGMVVEKLKAENLKLKVINDNPDGNFPAHGPNPLSEGALRDLQLEVVNSGADLGVIFDADGDRAFFTDDRGREVPADAVLFLLADNFPGPAVANILAGYLAKHLFEKAGKKLIETKVGHYFLKKVMKEEGASFGGEFSGHYYFPLGATNFDSGILSAVYMANEVSKMKADGRKLSDWLDELPVFHRSGELNFEVTDKEGAMGLIEKNYSKIAERSSRLDGLKMEFPDWWFVVRPSNTENLLRLVVEAKDKKVLDERLAELKKLI